MNILFIFPYALKYIGLVTFKIKIMVRDKNCIQQEQKKTKQ